METPRSSLRRSLDARLDRHLDLVGPPPGGGWIRAIRDALGISQFELGRRAGISQPRVAQIERAEARGAISLSTIRRIAVALDCSFSYVLAPRGPHDGMVRRHALRRANGDPALADQFIDRPGLWYSDGPVRASPTEEGA